MGDVAAAESQTEGVGQKNTTPEGAGKGAQDGSWTSGQIVADTSLFDRSILANTNAARKNLIDYARTKFPGSVINRETGNTIRISRNGLDKFLSGKISYEKYATGFHIPEILENARKTGEATDLKNRESIIGYDYYEAPISVDGTDYIAFIRVRKTTSGNSYYGHKIGEVDGIKIEPSARADAENAARPVNAIDGSFWDTSLDGGRPGAKPSSSGASSDDPNNTIPQSASGVNPESGTFNPVIEAYDRAKGVPEGGSGSIPAAHVGSTGIDDAAIRGRDAQRGGRGDG